MIIQQSKANDDNLTVKGQLECENLFYVKLIIFKTRKLSMRGMYGTENSTLQSGL